MNFKEKKKSRNGPRKTFIFVLRTHIFWAVACPSQYIELNEVLFFSTNGAPGKSFSLPSPLDIPSPFLCENKSKLKKKINQVTAISFKKTRWVCVLTDERRRKLGEKLKLIHLQLLSCLAGIQSPFSSPHLMNTPDSISFCVAIRK